MPRADLRADGRSDGCNAGARSRRSRRAAPAPVAVRRLPARVRWIAPVVVATMVGAAATTARGELGRVDAARLVPADRPFDAWWPAWSLRLEAGHAVPFDGAGLDVSHVGARVRFGPLRLDVEAIRAGAPTAAEQRVGLALARVGRGGGVGAGVAVDRFVTAPVAGTVGSATAVRPAGVAPRVTARVAAAWRAAGAWIVRAEASRIDVDGRRRPDAGADVVLGVAHREPSGDGDGAFGATMTVAASIRIDAGRGPTVDAFVRLVIGAASLGTGWDGRAGAPLAALALGRGALRAETVVRVADVTGTGWEVVVSWNAKQTADASASWPARSSRW